MKAFLYILSILKNKYLLVLIVFVAWMMFFDHNDMLTQMDRRRELKALEKSKEYFTQQIADERKSLQELKSNPAAIEKYAREKYLMKRDNEDIYLIQTAENK